MNHDKKQDIGNILKGVYDFFTSDSHQVPLHSNHNTNQQYSQGYSGQGDSTSQTAQSHRPDPDEYTLLRSKAHEEASMRSSCFERSKEAYNRGDGALAKQLSEEGHRHGDKMAQYNSQAAELIFTDKNGNIPNDEIDLHGLYVQESIEYTERKIKWCKQYNIDHLHVIVGKGNNSINHIQKIKPAIEELMTRHKFSCTPEHNEGRLLIRFGETGDLSWIDKIVQDVKKGIAKDGCMIM